MKIRTTLELHGILGPDDNVVLVLLDAAELLRALAPLAMSEGLQFDSVADTLDGMAVAAGKE